MSCDQMVSTSNDTSMFSMLNENAVMSIQRFEEISSSQKYFDRHIVRAAELPARDSSTEVVDVSKLSQKTTSIIRYIKIDATHGRLYCINGLTSTACWLKVVPFANNCHSYNVLLMFTIDGIIMKTIRNRSRRSIVDVVCWRYPGHVGYIICETIQYTKLQSLRLSQLQQPIQVFKSLESTYCSKMWSTRH